MDKVIESLLDSAILDVKRIAISDIKESSIRLTIEARVRHRGPFEAIIQPMTIELHGTYGMLGKLKVGEIGSLPAGRDIVIQDQEMKLHDSNVIGAILGELTQRESVTLTLNNGVSRAKALGLSVPIIFRKSLHFAAMGGVLSNSLECTLTPDTSSCDDSEIPANGAYRNVTIRFTNPSPVEINLRSVRVELTDATSGNRIGSFSGPIRITTGINNLALKGQVDQFSENLKTTRVILSKIVDDSEAIDSWKNKMLAIVAKN